MSVQEYVDCTDGIYENEQCDGGWYDYAWQYTQDLKTVSSENDYGYINGVVSVSLCNLTAVALHYPVSFFVRSITTTCSEWQ